jgi:hypothetical protein
MAGCGEEKQDCGPPLFVHKKKNRIKERIRREFGGADPKSSNIFFVQSSQDPWQWAGVRETLSPTEQEFTV